MRTVHDACLCVSRGSLYVYICHRVVSLVLQLERKRHLGNDIVVIIFVDGKNPDDVYESCLTFNPGCMKSHFNHIFALVTFDHIKNAYRYVRISTVHFNCCCWLLYAGCL